MTGKAFDKLVELTDRLEPNMWLKLDWVAFERCFDAEPSSTAAHERATAFAQDTHLTVFFDDRQRVVEFGRPYFNRDNDA